MKIKLLLLVSGAAMMGCASEPVDLTTITNWQKYGFEQANKGNVMLSDSEISADDFVLYKQGYEVGKKAYCSQDAYNLGMRGNTYHGICDDVSQDFKTQYELGRLEYLALKEKFDSE